MTTNGGYRSMKYVNREMKIDQIIGYFNQHKINLIPPFQRGTVWNLDLRQKLLVNMVQARPIPAVFLYKQAEGPQFAYNILDGKQRLESLILFVGDQRAGLKVKNVEHYFFNKPAVKNVNFEIELDGKNVAFKDLEDGLVRAFREYAIPTIEIDLDDENTAIDEIVNLFIDINQQGVKVSRFDVVKALGKDPLFKQIFDLIAVKQTRKKRSIYYKAKSGNFVFVMKRLNIVKRLTDKNSRVDRIWERLTEIALFARSGAHRVPSQILKAFISGGDIPNKRMTISELRRLRSAFDYLAATYRAIPSLMETKFATDQPQFYTLITSLLRTDLMDRFMPTAFAGRLDIVGKIMEGKIATPPNLEQSVDEYHDISTKATTNQDRRVRRQEILIESLNNVKVANEQAD